MWRPDRTVTVAGESRYYNVAREYNGALYYPAPGTLLTSMTYDKSYEVMYSESNGRLQQDNPCAHYKRSCEVLNPWIPGTRSWYNTNHTIPNPGRWIPTAGSLQPVEGIWNWSAASHSGLSTFGSCDEPNLGLPILAAPSTTFGQWVLHPTIDGDERNLLLQAALAAMLPGIKAAASVPNALFELKDFRTAGRSIRRLNKTLDGLRTIVQRRVSLRKGNDLRTRAATLRTIFKGVSDAFLQWNFNLASLIRDISAVQTSLKSLRSEIGNLIARANIPQERHFKRSLGAEYPDNVQTVVGTLPSTWVVTSMTFGRTVEYDVREFNATLRYRYKLPQASEDELVLRAILDRFGFNLNPAILWNATPWTFVIDWVIGVNRWLEQFQMKALEPTVHIDSFCYSLKARRTITTSLIADSFNGLVSRVVEEAYERKVGLDQQQLTSSLKMSGLNPKEISLSIALALSR